VKALFKLLLFVVIVGVMALLFFITAPSSKGDHDVVIKPGSSARQIGRDLQSAGVIRNAYAFYAWHLLHQRSPLKAGEYLFTSNSSLPDVYRKLVRGEIYGHAIVIPEGFSSFDIANALADAKLCTREQFLSTVKNDRALIADLDPSAPSLEGYLFPDTYTFTRTQSPHDMAAAMVHRFRQEAKVLGLSGDIHRIVTMASIVEKETAVAEERAMVAGVFENRLRGRIALGTDPSVIYASKLAGKFDGTIHQSDLQLDSLYNTYRNAGLPPGPIANPGRAALEAAMHPTQSDYLYFVANNHGGHNFARTLDEHNHNVAEYRRGLGSH
jgi:UPF0755 protein